MDGEHISVSLEGASSQLLNRKLLVNKVKENCLCAEIFCLR